MAKKRKAKSARKKVTQKSTRTSSKKAAIAGAKLKVPPYKCETTDEQGTCLKFYLNPRTGQYNLPPGGERVKCGDCEYFFD